jgi:hypothetical protein
MRGWSILVLLAALLGGCGGRSAADYQKEAQAALDGRDPGKAVEVVRAALANDAVRRDAAAAWRLEQIRLEALAKTGKGGEVKAELDRLAGTYTAQVTPALYRSLGDKTKAAGDIPGAIDILVAGDQRFPKDHASFAEAIEALKNAGGVDPAQVERLRALGYL